MYSKLEELLKLRIYNKRGRFIGDEFYGGELDTNFGKIKVVRGIPIIMPLRVRSYRKLYSAYQQIPPSHWLSTKSEWLRYLRKRLFLLLREAVNLLDVDIKRRINILALGCGWGWEILTLHNLLKARNLNSVYFVGCDIALNSLILARKVLRRANISNVDLVCCPSSYLPFKDNSFSFVTAIFGALDHDFQFWRIFREVHRVLVPRGVFVGTMINKFSLDWIIKVIFRPKLFAKTIRYANNLFARIRIPIKNKFVRIPTHFYSVFELKRFLRKYSFDLIRLESIFSLLPANFKRKGFNKIEKTLLYLDYFLSEKQIFNSLGRYLAFIAIRL